MRLEISQFRRFARCSSDVRETKAKEISYSWWIVRIYCRNMLSANSPSHDRVKTDSWFISDSSNAQRCVSQITLLNGSDGMKTSCARCVRLSFLPVTSAPGLELTGAGRFDGKGGGAHMHNYVTANWHNWDCIRIAHVHSKLVLLSDSAVVFVRLPWSLQRNPHHVVTVTERHFWRGLMRGFGLSSSAEETFKGLTTCPVKITRCRRMYVFGLLRLFELFEV